VAFRGLNKHLRRLKRLSSEAEKVAGQIVEEGAGIIRAEAFRMVGTGSASGQSGGKHQHTPSLPGQPPNREFGDLQAGFEVRRTGKLSAEFRAEAPHSAPLEFGTSKMAARPFMRPARDKKKKEVRDRMVKQMNTLVKRSG